MDIRGRIEKLHEKLSEARAEARQPIKLEKEQENKTTDALLSRGALIGIDRLAAPEAVDTRPQDYVAVSGELYSSVYINGFPNAVDDGWLSGLYRFEYPVDSAIYIQPIPIKEWLRREKQRLSQNEAAIRKEIADGVRVPNPRRVKQAQEMAELIEAVSQDRTRPYQVLVAATARSEDEKELRDIVDILHDRMNVADIRGCRFKELEGFETTLPLAYNQLAAAKGLDAVRFLHTEGVQTMFPFVNSVITHETGVMLGQSMTTLEPIIINRFLQPPFGNVQSPNAAIIGMTGSGKSYLAKLEMLYWLYQGVGVYVVDPTLGGEYRNIARGVEGRNIRIAIDSSDHINPMDFSYAVPKIKEGEALPRGVNPLAMKMANLIELIRVMLRIEGGEDIMDPVASKIFTTAALHCYKKYGYDRNDIRTQLGATPEKMPTLEDVFLTLDRMRRASRDLLLQQKINPLIASLENFIGDGQFAGLYNQRSNVDLGEDALTVFQVGDVSDKHMPIVMHMVLEFLRTTLFTAERQEGGGLKLIYVDECQRMLSFTETASFLAWIAATCRKYGVGLTVMTQQIGQFLRDNKGDENKIGQAVLDACSLTILLRQHSNEIKYVKEAFKLTTGETNKLRTVPAGEGLLLLDEDSCWFTAQHMATEEEHRLLSTTVAERSTFALDEHQIPELEAGGDYYEEEEEENGSGFFRPLGPQT